VDGLGYGVQLQRGNVDVDCDWGSYLLYVEGSVMAAKKKRKNARRPPGYGSFKGIARKYARQSASYVAGKRSASRKTHKVYREARDAARNENPQQLLFKSKAAAVAYAREHGAKRFSVKKLKRGR
jgi:hypothetical protein